MELLIIVILVAFVFEYINGFHDAANAIATVVSTKVLTPRIALLYGAVINFLGAFFGTHVAQTIGNGLVNAESITQVVILCALLGAIVWNLITWLLGIPSSSSHAMIGGLFGAAIVHSGMGTLKMSAILDKVIIPMIASPILGIIIGFAFMLLLLWIFNNAMPELVNRYFKKLQLISAGFMAFAHGSNDAQKTMGIITLSLFAAGFLKDINVPIWVICACAFTMSMGTMAGGWRIIKTMGSKIIKLKPIDGFAAETSAATVILTASHFGIPLSTTHVISSSIIGVGCTKKLSAVKWGVASNIVIAWIITIPFCMAISGGIYYIFFK